MSKKSKPFSPFNSQKLVKQIDFEFETLIDLLKLFLQDIMNREKDIENKWIQLALCENFNIFEIFKLCFDLKGSGQIDLDCFERSFDDL